MYKLPVTEVVFEAYAFLVSQWLAVMKNALPLVILILLVSFGLTPLIGNTPISARLFAFDAQIFLGLAVLLFGLALATVFAVTMHRLYLLPNAQGQMLQNLKPKRRHWRFIGWGIVVFIGLILLSLLFFGLPLFLLQNFLLQDPGSSTLVISIMFQYQWLTIAAGFALQALGWAFMFWLFSSALLRFPLIAIDASQKEIEHASILLRANRGRMTAVFLIGDYIPFTLFQLALVYAIGALIEPATSYGTPEKSVIQIAVIAGALKYLSTVVWLAITAFMLSIIYNRLKNNVPLEVETPAD